MKPTVLKLCTHSNRMSTPQIRRSSDSTAILAKFWDKAYSELQTFEFQKDKETSVSLYNDAVLNKLRDFKEKHDYKESTPHKSEEFYLKNRDNLVELQKEIESLTGMPEYQHANFYSSDIFNLFLKEKEDTAREHLKKSKLLSEKEIDLISHFDEYTLEAIIIHVLATLFSCLNKHVAVRAATLIEHFDSYVRRHAQIMRSRKGGIFLPGDLSDEKSKPKYAFGVSLFNFLIDRSLIRIYSNTEFDTPLSVSKKRGIYYTSKKNYVVCNFKLCLLPIKLSLPMVCEPKPWRSLVDQPRSLSDLSGGYLCEPTADVYHHNFRLLSSHNLSHFYIKIKNNECCEELCGTMNYLQSHSFEINSWVLNFIKKNYSLLVRYGLLMPRFLSKLNITEAADKLRSLYFADPNVTKVCKYSEILDELSKRVQRSRYETFILELADAYEGYHIYLPAFLDFRGRIYRSGILHFHERDLARSLLIFSLNKKGILYGTANFTRDVHDIIKMAAAFNYKKFSDYEEALFFYNLHCSSCHTIKDLCEMAAEAANPFQFISKVLCIQYKEGDPLKMPITQDASASAYQLMSFFLLDKNLAIHTNLIPEREINKTGKPIIRIRDVYTFFQLKLKEALIENSNSANRELCQQICDRLDRKIVKLLYMPLVYGKTVLSMSRDISEHFSDLSLSKRQCYDLARTCYEFWCDKFPEITNLIKLISNIGWFATALDRPVLYGIGLYTTVQDYMKKEDIKIWIYDRLHKKRRQVTLRVPTDKRDRRKTEVSTFANFIHQKDAHIAMMMIKSVDEQLGAPIYTVHDNFITPSYYSRYVSDFYLNVICQLDHPLGIINLLIYESLGLHGTGCEGIVNGDIPIITPEALKSVLEERMESYFHINKLSKKTKCVWERRILSIYEAYNSYLYTLIGRDPSESNSHERKKECFTDKVRSWEESPAYIGYKYPLHL